MRGAADFGLAEGQRQPDEPKLEDPMSSITLISRGGWPKQKAAKRRSLFEHPFAASYQAFTASCHDSQSLSVIFKHLRETGRILAQRLNRVKKKAQFLSCFWCRKPTLMDR